MNRNSGERQPHMLLLLLRAGQRPDEKSAKRRAGERKCHAAEQRQAINEHKSGDNCERCAGVYAEYMRRSKRIAGRKLRQQSREREMSADQYSRYRTRQAQCLNVQMLLLKT